MVSFFASMYEKFDPSQANKLAGLIQQAYDQFDERETKTWRLSEPYELLGSLGTENVPFGFVVSETDSNDVVVIFRGTKSFIEWFQDVNIQLVSYRDSTGKDIIQGVQQKSSSEIIPTINDFGYVTAGFRGIYISLREQMLEVLKKCPADCKIFVTGHSLGGALATLAIPDILNNTDFKDPQKVELYTFASPRCGDKTFATSFQETGVNHWRIANTEDFVTMLPFPTGNIFEIKSTAEKEREKWEKPVDGGGMTGENKNPNPIFGFFNDMFERVGEIFHGQKRRMPDYAHTGTPVYFTFHDSALERHHNLDNVYMTGIGQKPLIIKQAVNEVIDGN
ncbi:lipase class 3 [Cylindrospermum sp. NIES-4074]|nr:lipase class 3 [Cylindrospermum sp. NIES-4074]